LSSLSYLTSLKSPKSPKSSSSLSLTSSCLTFSKLPKSPKSSSSLSLTSSCLAFSKLPKSSSSSLSSLTLLFSSSFFGSSYVYIDPKSKSAYLSIGFFVELFSLVFGVFFSLGYAFSISPKPSSSSSLFSTFKTFSDYIS